MTIFIYDIDQYDLKSLLDDQRLISSLMQKNIIMSIFEAKRKIEEAYEKTLNFKNNTSKFNESYPCTQCGNIEFYKTGTCLTCSICGHSQGCS